jgi:hypothetical protein
MDSIRPVEIEDLPAIASLIELAFRSGSAEPARGLTDYLHRILVDHPWVDRDIPSLVSVDEHGRIVGCLCSHVRRFLLDGRAIRVAVSGQLVVSPEARGRATGAFLMKRYFEGPQDVTFTDTASKLVKRLWEGMGGDEHHLGRIGWVRTFAPTSFAAAHLLRDRPLLARVARPVSLVIDGLATLVAGRNLATHPPGLRSEPLTPAALVEAFPRLAGRARIRPDYDQLFLEWLFRTLGAAPSRGLPTGFLLRDRAGDLVGSYLYFLKPGGISQVVLVIANDGTAPHVLDHLFHHARTHGSAALQGRVESSLLEALSERHCVFHPAGYRVLVHARERTFIDALRSGDAIFTRLDGDWWMGLNAERFEIA